MVNLLAELATLQPQSSPAARLDQFARFHIRHHLDRPQAVFIAYMELRNLTVENHSKVAALRDTYEAQLEAILRDGVACADFNLRDIKLTTRALIAMLTGVTTWFVRVAASIAARIEAHYTDPYSERCQAPGSFFFVKDIRECGSGNLHGKGALEGGGRQPPPALSVQRFKRRAVNARV